LQEILETEGVHISNAVQPEVEAEIICFAGELIPNTDGFELGKAGIYVNKQKAIVLNEECRTSAAHVWAAGTVTGPPFEISFKKRQAELVCENVLGNFFSKTKLDFDPIPIAIPTFPPFCRVGLSENEAQEKLGSKVLVKTFPLNRNEKAMLEGHTEGWIKIIGKKQGAELLGAQVLAPHAEEIIVFFDLILRAGIPLTEFSEENHFPFGTYAEAIVQSITAFNQENY
jgi:pyruvate/2-oxoglutarate dehydrogenase complex dihydrolipoamide dehydrogenase (E3) component